MDYTILYVSNSRYNFSYQELSELLDKARVNNSRLNVSGFLIYVNNLFVQVLEGEKEDVQTLFEKIKKDKRHEKIMVIHESEISERLFDSWSMAFKKYNSNEELSALGYFTLEEFQEITDGVGDYDVLKVLRSILDLNLK